MAAKLKSILKPIHWSLVLKSAAFGASWFFMPFWAFLILGIYFYFIPLFRPFELAWPFFLVIFFAAIEPANVWLALFFAVIFYLILGIKELIFVNRKSSYEVLVLLILFLMFLRFFAHFNSGSGNMAWLYAFLICPAFFFLAKGFWGYGSLHKVARGGADHPDKSHSLPGKEFTGERHAVVAAGIMAFAVLELAVVLIFLPINFLYQSALLFVAAAIFVEFLIDYASGTLGRAKFITSFSIFFVFLVIILGSAQWSL